MKKGKLLKSLGRLAAGKTVEVSDATYVRLIETGHFAKEAKPKTETKEQKHEQVETKAAEVNTVVDQIIGEADKSEAPKRRGRKAKG